MPTIKVLRPAPMTTRVNISEASRVKLVLKPGDNEVSDAIMSALHSDPTVRLWREEGFIAYSDPAPDAPAKVEPPKAIPAAPAKK